MVDEPLNEKIDDADLKKPVPEEVIPPPTETKVEEPKPEEVKEKDSPATPPTEDSKKEDDVKPDPEHEAIDLPSSSGTFNFLPTWLKDLFGKSDKKFIHDWESPTLECFIVSKEFRLLKLPFGHQRLTYGLKRTQRKIGLTWDQYMALDSPHKKEISKAISKARALDSRQRTCVAIGAQKKSEDDFVVLFMTLGPKVEPIKFKDAVGRQYNVPFENCKTWEVSSFPSQSQIIANPNLRPSRKSSTKHSSMSSMWVLTPWPDISISSTLKAQSSFPVSGHR